MYNGWGSRRYSSRVWPATLEPTSKRPMTSDPSWRAWREASTHSLSTLWISARGFAKISHALSLPKKPGGVDGVEARSARHRVGRILGNKNTVPILGAHVISPQSCSSRVIGASFVRHQQLPK